MMGYIQIVNIGLTAKLNGSQFKAYLIIFAFFLVGQFHIFVELILRWTNKKVLHIQKMSSFKLISHIK
jgi:hypothetical protein